MIEGTLLEANPDVSTPIAVALATALVAALVYIAYREGYRSRGSSVVTQTTWWD